MVVAALVAAFVAAPSRAEVQQSAPDGFTVAFTRTIDAPPASVYAAIIAIDRWWSGEHTYSGDAHNLTLGGNAGDCFCERWKDPAGRDNSARHGVVLMARADQALRIEGALGPLQGMGVGAVLSIATRGEGGGTVLTMVYKVNGSSASGLDTLAPSVNAVLQAQFTRLANFAATGKPD
jgi:uncharacterized protein YndB with AHSA1/START domain